MSNSVTLIDIAPAKTVAPVQVALDLCITQIEDTVARYPWAAVTTAAAVETLVAVTAR